MFAVNCFFNIAQKKVLITVSCIKSKNVVNAFNFSQIHFISTKGISIRKIFRFILCIIVLISIKSFSTRRIIFPVEHHLSVSNYHVALNYICAFLSISINAQSI